MDLSPVLKRLACTRHPNETVVYVCTFPDCQAPSVSFCPKCQVTEAGHFTQHKKFMQRTKDFLDSQFFIAEPPLVDELLVKTNEIEQKLLKIEEEYKKEDVQIDKDFGSLFAIFFKVTETGKNILKSSLRENFTKISERNMALRKSLEYLKVNKNDPNELKKTFAMFNKDNTDEQFRIMMAQRQQKYDTLNMNLADIISELDSNVREKPIYKKSPYSQSIFEELKTNFDKTCYNVINHLKSLIEISGAKPIPIKKIDLTAGTALDRSSPVEKQYNASVARIAQDIERSRSIANKGPLSQSQFVTTSRDTSLLIDHDNLSPAKRFRGLITFPEITNPKVLEVLTKAPPILYPDEFRDDFTDFQTPLTNYKCFELPDISVYQGQWRNNKRQGLGRIVYLDGGIYEGTWINDVPSGYGRVIRRNGEMYEGYINDYKADGKGSLTSLDGYRYTGDWVEDKKHGTGEEYIENSMYMYRGEFSNGLYHGQGLLKLHDGKVFEGTFVEGKFTGKGAYYSPASDDVQDQYEGDFVDWKKHGKGVYQLLNDGSRYEGDFVNDVPEGYGEFTYADGTVFRGLWKNGKQHGIGEEINPDGVKRDGEWVDGKWKKWLN